MPQNNISKIKVIIFDWGRAIYDNENQGLSPETRAVLEHLAKKYLLALVCLVGQGTIEERKHTIEECGLGKYFRSILLTADNKDLLYEEALKKLQIIPQDTCIIDDRTIRGIAWGNKNGAMTIWLKMRKFRNELSDQKTGQPAYTISDLKKLKALL